MFFEAAFIVRDLNRISPLAPLRSWLDRILLAVSLVSPFLPILSPPPYFRTAKLVAIKNCLLNTADKYEIIIDYDGNEDKYGHRMVMADAAVDYALTHY